jgi:hypothetical protein
MAMKFKTKLLFSRTGVFDSIGIGVQNPNLGLHVSGADLTLTSGSAYFDNRPLVNGSPVMLSGDTVNIDVSDLYPASNPSGFVTSDAITGYYPSSNPSGFINQIPNNLFYTTGDQKITGSVEVTESISCSGIISASGARAVTSLPSDSFPVHYITVLTQGEYDAIASPNVNTLYFIKP